MKKRAIFVDRDGTIIREPADEQVDSLEKLRFVPGAISALQRLARAGWELVLVSNQDGLGTPSFPEETFWPAHNLMLDTLRGEGVEFAAEHIDRTFPADNAPTRKPGTAMLTGYLTGDYDLAGSYVIGDRQTDLQLAENLGARGLLLTEAYGWDKIVETILAAERTATVERRTAETDISITLNLNGMGDSAISTGLKFFDHMLWQLPHHAGISLSLSCKGDLEVDEHHTVEDVAIALGDALRLALGSKRGIERYGFVLPMDECDATVVMDLGGRIDFSWDVAFTRDYVGDVPTELWRHFFASLCHSLRCNLHISARGENNHHLIEGVFKAFARALRAAIRRDPFNYSLPSSKGAL